MMIKKENSCWIPLSKKDFVLVAGDLIAFKAINNEIYYAIFIEKKKDKLYFLHYTFLNKFDWDFARDSFEDSWKVI